MRRIMLEESTASAEVDLTTAYPWPDGRAWTRVAMLRSLDGGVAGADGRSRSLSSSADREVLAGIRRFADAIVVGAGTVREEPYGPLVPDAATVAARRLQGLADAPAFAIVSRTLELPWDAAMLTQSLVRPLVLTSDQPDSAALARASAVVDVVVQLPGTALDGRGITEALHARGLRRLLCEGGPSLLSSFTAQDAVDEIDLTIAPLMPARHGSGDRGNEVVPPVGYRLESLLEHDSFLFARYLRDRS